MRVSFSLVLFIYMISAVFAEPVKSACVMDVRSGRYICGYNEDVQTQPASLTKMMTLFLTFKALQAGKISLGSKIKVSKRAASQKPCILGLKEGSVITVRTAILALVTKSANDVAVALGEYIGGSESKFVDMMNKEAELLGMNSTTFVNPSGWKNSKQLTTARDMSKLARALIRKYPRYYRFFAIKSFFYNKAGIRNHNKLLGRKADGTVVDGIKTGYVAASGYNLAASARKGRRRLIAVVLGGTTAKQRDKEVSRLLKIGFKHKFKKSKRLSEVMARKKIGVRNLAKQSWKRIKNKG